MVHCVYVVIDAHHKAQATHKNMKVWRFL